MREFFMVYKDGQGNNAPAAKHYDRLSAEKEAARLARNNPGEMFYILYAFASCTKQDVVWDSNEIPF